MIKETLFISISVGQNLETLGKSSDCFMSLQFCAKLIGFNTDSCIQLSPQGADDTPSLADCKSSLLTAVEQYSLGKFALNVNYEYHFSLVTS